MNLLDGFSGMGRDIFLRLCILLWDKPELIRVIVGMCKKHFEWKKHRYFRLRKSHEDLSPTVFPNPTLKDDVDIDGSKFSKKGGICSYCFVLDKVMVDGIFKIMLKYECIRPSSCCCGLVQESKLSHFHELPHGKAGYCVLFLNGLECGDKGVYVKNLFWPTGKHTIGLELAFEWRGKEGVDGLKKDGTLHFLVNKKQIPHAITRVPPFVHFYFTMQAEKSAEVLSFQKLAAPSTFRLPEIERHEWR